MHARTRSQLDVSPEEEAFLARTFRRHARSYLALSVFALGFAIAGLGFGLRNAAATGFDGESLRDTNRAAIQQIDELKLAIHAQLEASTAVTQRLDVLEEQLAGFESTPGTLKTRVDGAYQRIRSLEKKQGITTEAPASPDLYKRLNALETRLSVIELERE